MSFKCFTFTIHFGIFSKNFQVNFSVKYYPARSGQDLEKRLWQFVGRVYYHSFKMCPIYLLARLKEGNDVFK
jgi:hypothetical protein